MAINIASILHEDGANGPGLRCTVFVQGCRHQCKNCHSKHTWPFGTGASYTPEQLIAECTKNPLEDGITFTGGDPVYQYKELLPVVRALKDKNKILYTGFEVTELLDMCSTDVELTEFISSFKFVITGRYREDLQNPNILFRGSSNQKVLIPMYQNNRLSLFDISSTWDSCVSVNEKSILETWKNKVINVFTKMVSKAKI